MSIRKMIALHPDVHAPRERHGAGSSECAEGLRRGRQVSRVSSERRLRLGRFRSHLDRRPHSGDAGSDTLVHVSEAVGGLCLPNLGRLGLGHIRPIPVVAAEPFPEAKLVRCSRGAVYDVIVDLRTASATFARWAAVELSGDTGRLYDTACGC